MLNYSTRFKELIKSDVLDVLYELNITLVDGTQLTIDNTKLWGDSLSLEDATSENGKFTIGAAISTKLTFGLNNMYGDFNNYSFDRAIIVLKIGMMVDDVKEMVQVGTFTVDDADYDSLIISITALDNFIKMDSQVEVISFPTTTQVLVQNICSTCGITNMADGFLRDHNYVVKEFDYSNMTYRALLVALCQYMGCFAKMDAQGRLNLNWYKDIFDEVDHQDVEVVDTFSSIKLSTDFIEISGVEVDLDDEHTYSIGAQNYVVVVSNNPLIVDEEMAIALRDRLYVQVGGYRFKKCEAELLLYLWLESGDVIYVKESEEKYPIFISNRTLNSNGGVSISCDAETPLRNSLVGSDSSTNAIRQLRKDLKKEKDDRTRVEEELRQEIAGAGGVYVTEVEGAEGEGGKIKYLHNKPLLADSAIQWKFTATTISVSKDYGQTWEFALNSDGQAILNQIYALGINADYVNTGFIRGLSEFKVNVYSSKSGDTYSNLTNWFKLSSTSSSGCTLTNHNEYLDYNQSNQLWMRATSTQESFTLGNILKRVNSTSSNYTNYLYFTTNSVDKSSGSTNLYNTRYNDSLDTFDSVNYITLTNGTNTSSKSSNIYIYNKINSNNSYNANTIAMASTQYENYGTSSLVLRNYNGTSMRESNYINMNNGSKTYNALTLKNFYPEYDGSLATDQGNILQFEGNAYSSNNFLKTTLGNMFEASSPDNTSYIARYYNRVELLHADNYNDLYITNYQLGRKATYSQEFIANRISAESDSNYNVMRTYNYGVNSETVRNSIEMWSWASGTSEIDLYNYSSGGNLDNRLTLYSSGTTASIELKNKDSELTLGPNGNCRLYAWNSVTMESLNYYCYIHPYSSQGESKYIFARDGIYFGTTNNMRKILSV